MLAHSFLAMLDTRIKDARACANYGANESANYYKGPVIGETIDARVNRRSSDLQMVDTFTADVLGSCDRPEFFLDDESMFLLSCGDAGLE
jgi:hypothetical protein